MVARAIAICCLAALSGNSAWPISPLQSARAKMERIEEDRALPGSTIVLTAAELLAYANEQAQIIAPGALTGTVLTLTAGRAEASTSINFLRIRQAEGHADNWLAKQLLDGERPVRVRVRFESAHGRARVDVERVEVAGVAMQGSTLDFLLRQFVIPNFPDARVGSWFALGHRIERFEVVEGAVRVVIGR